MAKSNKEKVAAEVAGMQQDLKDLQKALADLVNAVIEEERPSLRLETTKLAALKKKALSSNFPTEKSPLSISDKSRRRKLSHHSFSGS